MLLLKMSSEDITFTDLVTYFYDYHAAMDNPDAKQHLKQPNAEVSMRENVGISFANIVPRPWSRTSSL